MPTRECLFFGSHYGPRGTETATVIFPRSHIGPFPVLYLLHGLTQDNNSWIHNTDIERQVRELPLVVVMPNGLRGFYTDSDSDPAANYESAVVDDMIRNIGERCKTIASPAGRVIAGNSMGGYGAIKLALKHPDKFSAAYSISGALRKGSSDYSSPPAKEWADLFGPSPTGGPHDLATLARGAIAQGSVWGRAPLSQLSIDCGVDDSMLHESRHFHTVLDELHIPHSYVEEPGGHNWEYWNARVPNLIAWACAALGIETP